MVDLSVYNRLNTFSDYEKANQEEQMNRKLMEQKLMGGGGQDPAALRLANEYLAAKQSGDIERANAIESFAKTREKNVMMTSDGQYVPLQGMPGALGQLEYGKSRGGQQGQKDVDLVMNPQIQYGTTIAGDEAELVNAGQLAAEKAYGGQAPERDKSLRAKAKVTGNLNAIAQSYQDLNQLGGSIDIENDFLSNLMARAGASRVGQGVGTALGTEVQSLRNQIKSLRPTLVNDIRQASEMGAKGMDSEKELEFFLQAATDPARDIQSNMAAIAVLDRAYGLGSQMQADPDAVNNLYREFLSNTGQEPRQQSEPQNPSGYQRGEIEFNLKKQGFSQDQINEYMKAKGMK